jgi:segregation and condensation protein A
MGNPTFFLAGIVRSREEMQDFEGPLNLILMLLSKNKIEIRDIQISVILEQYLEYIKKMQEMDLEVASEFVQMASHLVYIKTKTLLKSGEEDVSELELLMSSLEHLKCRDMLAQVKAVIPGFSAASAQGSQLLTKQPEPLPRPAGYIYRHAPVELLTSLASVFSRGKQVSERESPVVVPRRIVYGVREKSRQLIIWLRERGPTSLNALYKECATRSEVVATFISVLELCSMGNLGVALKDGDFIVSFTGGDTEKILESILEQEVI